MLLSIRREGERVLKGIDGGADFRRTTVWPGDGMVGGGVIALRHHSSVEAALSGIEPKTISGWAVLVAGGLTTMMAALPAILVTEVVGRATGRDPDKMHDAVANFLEKAIDKGVGAADKYNEEIFKAGMKVIAGSIEEGSSSRK
ncbi:hypothetical protein ABZ615_11510 [Streptomyces sp. NPDC007325]|uniref:hypothetical protein n=1 Tax=Streptomyces sp. NPDC007325 TaxID=3154588 RepID=UPI00340E21A1